MWKEQDAFVPLPLSSHPHRVHVLWSEAEKCVGREEGQAQEWEELAAMSFVDCPAEINWATYTPLKISVPQAATPYSSKKNPKNLTTVIAAML